MISTSRALEWMPFRSPVGLERLKLDYAEQCGRKYVESQE
jgi:hypothetical protein